MTRTTRRRPGDATLAIGYLRVSTEEQALGPAAQRSAIEPWAKANGVRVVAWFDDLGVGGGAPLEDRPGLVAAIDALADLRAGNLVVAKRDRLARDVMIAAMVERLAQRAGARIVSADGTGNGDSPEAVLMRTIVDAFASYERALIRARTKSALAIKRSRGERTSGIAPFGFRFSRDGKKLVADERERAVVDRVMRMYESGVSLSGIARTLNAERVPSRGVRWYPGSIFVIVRASA